MPYLAAGSYALRSGDAIVAAVTVLEGQERPFATARVGTDQIAAPEMPRTQEGCVGDWRQGTRAAALSLHPLGRAMGASTAAAVEVLLTHLGKVDLGRCDLGRLAE